MEVSMDGLRKRLVYNYNSLVEKLNYKNEDGEVKIDASYIQNELDNLRSLIVTLAFTYMDGEGGWQEMDENTHFEVFNEEDF